MRLCRSHRGFGLGLGAKGPRGYDGGVTRHRSGRVRGKAVPATEKVASLVEPRAAILPRHKPGRPVDVGRKLWLAEVEGGIVTQARVLEGAPPDAAKCDDPQQVVVEATLQREPSGSDTRYRATGFARNTCNYSVSVSLQIAGLDSAGAVIETTTASLGTLTPGEERAFASTRANSRRGKSRGVT